MSTAGRALGVLWFVLRKIGVNSIRVEGKVCIFLGSIRVWNLHPRFQKLSRILHGMALYYLPNPP